MNRYQAAEAYSVWGGGFWRAVSGPGLHVMETAGKAGGSHIYTGIPLCKVFFTRMEMDKGSMKILDQKAQILWSRTGNEQIHRRYNQDDEGVILHTTLH